MENNPRVHKKDYGYQRQKGFRHPQEDLRSFLVPCIGGESSYSRHILRAREGSHQKRNESGLFFGRFRFPDLPTELCNLFFSFFIKGSMFGFVLTFLFAHR